jgi:hypothetical protein
MSSRVPSRKTSELTLAKCRHLSNPVFIIFVTILYLSYWPLKIPGDTFISHESQNLRTKQRKSVSCNRIRGFQVLQNIFLSTFLTHSLLHNNVACHRARLPSHQKTQLFLFVRSHFQPYGISANVAIIPTDPAPQLVLIELAS